MLKLTALAGLFFCLVLALLSAALLSSRLHISTIELVYAQEPKYSELAEIEQAVQDALTGELLWAFPRRNALLVWLWPVDRAVLRQFPALARVQTAVFMPDKVTVTVEERESVGIWCEAELYWVEKKPEQEESEEESEEEEEEQEENEKSEDKPELQEKRRTIQCLHIDSGGVIYEKTPVVLRGDLLLNIFDVSGQSAEPGQQVVSEALMQHLAILDKRFRQVETRNGAPLRVREFEIVSVEEVRVLADNGWKIYLNPGHTVADQIKLLQGIVGLSRNQGVRYVDLRIAGRAYYLPLGVDE